MDKRATTKRKSVEDEEPVLEENVEDENQKRARGDPTSTVTIIPSTDFATKILPRAITEITALAELVDNAIEATNDLDDRVERIVRVQFDHQARTLSIEDNGCGMDSRRVVECFSLGHSERSADNLEAAHKSAAKEIEAVSNFSRHGVGAKTAIFKLGRRAEIVTRSRLAPGGSTDATRLLIDLDKIEQQKSWTAERGVARRNLPGTTITISQLSDDAIAAFRGHGVPSYLAQLYHFHIVGLPAVLYSLKEDHKVKLVSIFFNGVNLNTIANPFTDFLVEVKKDYVQQLSFRLALPYANPTKTHARMEDQTALVHIFLFYFPAIQGRETRPVPQMNTLLDSGDDIFWFWQGRFLPQIHASLPPLLRSGLGQAHGIPPQALDRVMGIVILPAIMTTSDYKTNIWSEDKLWKRVQDVKTYQDSKLESPTPGRETPKQLLTVRVKDWLKACHQYDGEVGLHEPLPLASQTVEGITLYNKATFPLRTKVEKGEKVPKAELAIDQYFRYKCGKTTTEGTRAKVGKVIYFYRNEDEADPKTLPKDKLPVGDLVHFREVYHKDSDELGTILVADITEVLTDRQMKNHFNDMAPKAITRHSDPQYLKSYPFPEGTLKSDQKYDFGVQIQRANGDVFRPLKDELYTIEISLSDKTLAPWTCTSAQAHSNSYYWYKVSTPKKRGKVTFTWRVVDAPKEFLKKIEPLAVEFMFSLGDVKYIRPEFGDGHPTTSAPLNQPISVRLLRADGADSPIGFETLDPISVDVYRSQKSTQPMYTLPLTGSKLAQDDGSLQYAVGEFTLSRVGPNEEEIKGAETLWIGFTSQGLTTRPISRLQLTVCSGPVASIRFDPDPPVPESMRYKETLPTCKVTLLDEHGEPVCRPTKKGPSIKLKSNGLKLQSRLTVDVDDHGRAELPAMVVSAAWGQQGSLALTVSDPSGGHLMKEFTFAVPERHITLRHADLEAGNTFNIIAGGTISDIKVQIEDERNKVDAEYNGDLSLIFPNKEDRRSVSITGGRGIIKELPVSKSGKASFRLASAEKEEESGLSTIIHVIVAAGKPEKFDLHMVSNGKAVARLAVAQPFSLGIAMQDSMGNRVPFTEEVWAELHPHLRLQISAVGDTGEARDIPLTGSCALEDGVARVMDLVLSERHGSKQLRLTDRRDPPQLAEATFTFPLSVGPPELLYITPALVEMQSGAETDIMVEVQDAGGNVITAHGAIVGEATGFQQFAVTPVAEKSSKAKKGAVALPPTWRLRAVHVPRDEPYTVKLVATLTAPTKKTIAADLSVLIRPNLSPASVEVIEPGRIDMIQAGSKLPRFRVIVRRSDRSVYSQPGLKAVLSLNGHSRNGLVSDESITWHDISAPNTLGNHVVTISLLINDQTIFSQPISITVVTGPPERIELLSPMQQMSIKKLDVPPVILQVTDGGGNAIVQPLWVLTEALVEATTQGPLPTLAGSPVKKELQGRTVINDLRLTSGITSNVSLQFKLADHPHITLASPSFLFQGETQVPAHVMQKSETLNKLKELNMKLDALKRRRSELTNTAPSAPTQVSRDFAEVKRKLHALEKDIPAMDPERERPVIAPLASLELQPGGRSGIIGSGVQMGKVADAKLCNLLSCYSSERLKALVIKDSASFTRLRPVLGEQQAFVLEQNKHRFADEKCLDEHGFLKFTFQPSAYRYVLHAAGEIFPAEEGVQFLVNTIQCSATMRREWWYYVFRDALLFDTRARLDQYLDTVGRAAQNLIALTGEACIDGMHRKIRVHNNPVPRFACPNEAERRAADTEPFLPEFVCCLGVGKQYRVLLNEYHTLQTKATNEQGAMADSARSLEEARKADEQIEALTKEIARVQASLRGN